MVKSILAASLATILGLGLVSLTPAQAQQTGSPLPPPQQTETPKQAQAGAPLQADSLQVMLQQLGYEHEPLRNAEGQVYGYLVKVPQGSWTVKIVVEVIPNGRFVFVTAWLDRVPEGSTVPTTVLTRMLKENMHIEPASLFFDEQTQTFAFNIPLYNNGGITLEGLKYHIDFMAALVVRLEPVWNPQKWYSAPAPR